MLDREFDNQIDVHESALARLAGGIANLGHQCGMLWGASLGVGVEAAKREQDPDEAIGLALAATAEVVASFEERTHTVDCRDVTGRNLDTVRGLAGLMWDTMRKGMDESTCFVLAENWTPEVIGAAHEGLDAPHPHSRAPRSCASEVARKMGATEREAVMVAGYGGGLGLSGAGCGALAAAVWMKGLQWCREHPDKAPGPWSRTGDKKTLAVFREQTGGEFICRKICGRTFESIDAHAEFVDGGGCAELIEALAEA